jgi:hypothetical protein
VVQPISLLLKLLYHLGDIRHQIPLKCFVQCAYNWPPHTTHLAYLLEMNAPGYPLTASAAHLYWKYIPSKPLFMSKSKPQKDEHSSLLPQIEQLLSEQTSVSLQAVDERFVAQEMRLLAAVDKRLEKMEQRFAKSLDELTKTLDKFLKRLSDIEEEFTFMKEDIKRVKAVLREKLGVSLD